MKTKDEFDLTTEKTVKSVKQLMNESIRFGFLLGLIVGALFSTFIFILIHHNQ